MTSLSLELCAYDATLQPTPVTRECTRCPYINKAVSLEVNDDYPVLSYCCIAGAVLVYAVHTSLEVGSYRGTSSVIFYLPIILYHLVMVLSRTLFSRLLRTCQGMDWRDG